MTNGAHWNRVYGDRDETDLTWFEDVPEPSLALIRAHASTGAVVDIGGGASRLVDHLLVDGYGPVVVLDLSENALAAARTRLGDRAGDAEWIVADVTGWTPDRRFDLWHDRAVFHFLTDAADRARYIAVMDAALGDGGIAVIGTFAQDGPERCSGLPVQRYSPEALVAEIESHAPGRFTLLESRRHVHVTAGGARQNFQFSVFRKGA